MVENQMTEARKIYDIKMQVQQCCSVDPAMCENVTNLNIKRMNPTSIIVNSLFHTYDYFKILWYEYFFEWFLSKSKNEHHSQVTRLGRSGVTRPEK